MGIRILLIMAFLSSVGGAALYIFKQGEKIGQLEGDLQTANQNYEIARESLDAKSAEVEDLRKALEIFMNSNTPTNERDVIAQLCEDGDFIDPENICDEV